MAFCVTHGPYRHGGGLRKGEYGMVLSGQTCGKRGLKVTPEGWA